MEIAVRLQSNTTSRFNGERFITRQRDAEDVVVSISSQRIKHKWIEILGDLFTPEKRAAFQGFNYASSIEAIWNEEFRTVWRALDNGEMSLGEAWAAIKLSGNVDGGLPLDPSASTNVTNTWVWGQAEMRGYGLASVNDDLLSETYVDSLTSVVEYNRADGSILTVNKMKLDTSAIGLSPEQIARYMDSSIAIPVNHANTLPITTLVVK